ncbi:MAG TPA: AraC family ligand binding domain-containing protein [Terracidiphilus sp.]|jgi:quercetin dioxygenase-like cupin family protein|nr:AraC family ligand binding domain-containing protein [Terracidiphilus sp.]
MPIPGSADDGTMTADLAQFDLARELAEFERHKPWPSGTYARTLFKKSDFRVVLICMEAAAAIREHHADGTSSVQVLKGAIRYKTQGQIYELKTGSLLTLGASIKHDVEAIDESAFLLTISWPDNAELLAMPHRGYGT